MKTDEELLEEYRRALEYVDGWKDTKDGSYGLMQSAMLKPLEDEMRRRGIRWWGPTYDYRASPDGPTPAERLMAEMAASGAGEDEIAQAVKDAYGLDMREALRGAGYATGRMTEDWGARNEKAGAWADWGEGKPMPEGASDIYKREYARNEAARRGEIREANKRITAENEAKWMAEHPWEKKVKKAGPAPMADDPELGAKQRLGRMLDRWQDYLDQNVWKSKAKRAGIGEIGARAGRMDAERRAGEAGDMERIDLKTAAPSSADPGDAGWLEANEKAMKAHREGVPSKPGQGAHRKTKEPRTPSIRNPIGGRPESPYAAVAELSGVTIKPPETKNVKAGVSWAAAPAPKKEATAPAPTQSTTQKPAPTGKYKRTIPKIQMGGSKRKNKTKGDNPPF